MAGRTYEEPGAPASEADEKLKAKRRAHQEKIRDKRRKSTEGTYISYPAEFTGGEREAATKFIRTHAPEDADLLLSMLGLAE